LIAFQLQENRTDLFSGLQILNEEQEYSTKLLAARAAEEF
jgi:hypothetical protein